MPMFTSSQGDLFTRHPKGSFVVYVRDVTDMDVAFCPYSAYISTVFLHVSCKLADVNRN